MSNINEKNYKNLPDAVAFVVAFVPMIYSYGSVGWNEYLKCVCPSCGKYEQYGDFLTSKSNCKKNYGILDSYHYALCIDYKEELCNAFNVSEDDFRPIRNKVGDIVFYQITPQHTMLPISSVNRIKALKPCRKCSSVQHRIKEYTNEKGEIYYYITKEALEDLHDFNKTCEEFDMFFPLYVVSRRVYEYLIAKEPRMRFYPMFLKDN